MAVEPPSVEAWRAYDPWQAAQALRGARSPWCVVGGWAIDLWLGKQTREHSDLELAVPRVAFPTFRAALAAFELYTPAGDSEIVPLPQDGFPLPGWHQVWALDPVAREFRFDVMLEPGDEETWACRRDESLTLPRSRAVRATEGVPYLAPEAVLLFKAKRAEDKDEADLEACLPTFSPEQRRWLLDALARVHPGHAWADRLRG